MFNTIIKRALLIDMDAYILNPVKFDKIIEITDSLHKVIRDRFELSVTNKFVNEIMDRRIE